MSKKRKKLTDENLAKLLPVKRKRYSKADTDQRGLHIRMTPNGVRSLWAVERDPYGKQDWILLGHWPDVKIDEAREKARDIVKRIKAGKPPIEPKPPAPETLAAIAEGWLQRYVVVKKLRSEQDIRYRLTKYMIPALGDHDFAGIRRSHITRLLDHIQDNHGARTADQVLGDFRGLALFYATRHDDYTSPIIRGMKRGDNDSRDRVLDDDELRLIWRAAGEAGRFGAIIKLALLTGQRRGKLISMKWDDVRDGVWHIPQEDREKPAGGDLVLPQIAIDIIEAQPRLGSNPFVFPAYRGRSHVFGVGMLKQAFDKRLAALGWERIVRKPGANPNWTLHDLRRTARSLMSRKETGIDRDTAERVLGHSIGTAVSRRYDQHDYDEQKAEALAALAALIERIVAGPPPSNVVQGQFAAHA